MGPRKEVSIDEKNLIIQEHKKGKSYRAISKFFNKPFATVQYIIKKFKTTGSVENKPRSGRPKKLSRRDVSLILREVDKNPRISAPKLAESIANSTDKTVHPKTIQRALRGQGYASRVPRRKPLISEKNRRLRLEFAKTYLNKDINFWKRVLFTDESKFNLFGNDGRGKVWRKKNAALEPKNVVPTVKHGGGNVMAWGAMAASGVGRLVFIDGIMDRYYYKQLLEHNLQPSVDMLGLGQSWIFQQDNDPKHTAIIVRDWLLYHAPRQLKSPPQSPDLNPIEHVWDVLKRKIAHVDVPNKQKLKDALQKCWSEITPDVTENLVASMPRRLQAVIDAKGGPTKY